MTLDELNLLLNALAQKPSREAALKTAFSLMEWMGLAPNPDGKERLLQVQKQELKKYLVNHPLTAQPQLYRLAADGQNVQVRLAVVKKIRKDGLRQLVDKESKMEYQSAPPVIQQLPTAPAYHLHIVATEKHDGLYVVLHQGEQKRIMALRKKLTQTQRNKIVPQWQNIAAKSKPEIAQQFWKSLDLKEVNKDFYKQIKERFDALLGIARQQQPGIADAEVKQFAVRLIGRYIFCWFLKEKGIIPEALLSSATVEQYPQQFFQQYLTKLFFETLNAEVTDSQRSKTTTQLDALYQHIPYLNGGLFDQHPEDYLFEKLDLNAWLAAFVKVLEGFDFTVDESSSQYQLVAIDPEMLGRIFENLLASQNKETEKLANERKAFGAFYTPREIVDYMVNESLKAHLETALLPNLPQLPEAAVISEPLTAYKGTLFEHAEPRQTLMNFDNKEKAALAEAEKKRDRLKGKIARLMAPDCAENPFDKEETTSVRKALAEVKVLDPACGSGAFPMGVLLRLMELRQIAGHGHRNNYDLKNEILSRNIFGVDIMPMAVEIARLRAWLSLVLEADYKPADRKNNFGVAALPNLDFKFVCANSLIDSGYDAFLHHVEISGTLTLMRLHGEIQKLEGIREQYFDPRGDKHKKESLQAEFIATKNYIKQEFAPLKKTWNLEDFLSKVDDWNPFDDSHPSSFFSPAWMFGVTDGFDVVIGNPPYVPMESLSEDLRKEYKKKYKIFERKFETSVLFIVDGLSIANKNGILSFIAPITWQTGENYTKFRKYILGERGIKSILNLPFDMFEAAYIDTSVYILSKQVSTSYLLHIFDKKEKNLDLLNVQYEKVEINKITAPDYKLILNNEIDSISSLFKRKQFKTLGSITKSTQGLSGSRFLESNNNIYDDNIFPFLNKGNVFNYFLKIDQTYPTDLSDKKSLKQFYQEEPKVLIRRIINRQDRLSVSYCEKKLVFKKDINPFIPTDSSFSTKFLLAILASNLISKIYSNSSSIAGKDDFRQTTLAELRKIPIRVTSIEIQQPFITRVEKILSLKQQNQPTTELEKEIDVLVYKLYELNYEEVKIIDPAFWLSAEEYEKVEIK